MHHNYAEHLPAQDPPRLKEAEWHLERAIDLHPGYTSAYNNLGVILGRQGRQLEAARVLSRGYTEGDMLRDDTKFIMAMNVGQSYQMLAVHSQSVEQLIESYKWYTFASRTFGAKGSR